MLNELSTIGKKWISGSGDFKKFSSRSVIKNERREHREEVYELFS